MTSLDPIPHRTASTPPSTAFDAPLGHDPIAERRLTGLASRASFLVNGDKYFQVLAQAFSQARRSIWIVGWDFNPDILLSPGDEETLGELLKSVADADPKLEVRILVWALGPLYSQKSLSLFRRRDFPGHPRIRLEFARQSSLRSCHHQKLVCVDDDIGFIGGIDLTSRRWDTADHLADDGRRRAPTGEKYGPLHDIQVMVTGEAARCLGAIVRRRWEVETGERHPLPVAVPDQKTTGAGGLSMKDVPVRFAITEPKCRSGRAVNDGIALTLGIIGAAKRHLYIETQYLASARIADALASRLMEPSGPEIVIVCTRSSHGLIEKLIMGKNRRRMVRRLKKADRYRRLRIFYPVVADAQGETEVLVHAKLLICDDRQVRIGSSNLNRRSEGLDTECDMLLEAILPAHLKAIADLRSALLAEHLGVSKEAVRDAVARFGSLLKAIDVLNVGPRGLRPLDANVGTGSIEPVTGTALFDPAKPFSGRRRLRALASRLRSMLFAR